MSSKKTENTTKLIFVESISTPKRLKWYYVFTRKEHTKVPIKKSKTDRLNKKTYYLFKIFDNSLS